MSTRSRFEGEPQHPELGRSRALHYGDGVFRTCLIHGGKVLDLDRHIRKLGADSRALDLKPPAATRLRHEANALASQHSVAVLKVILFRSGEGRGYLPVTRRAEHLMQIFPAPKYPAAFWSRGVRAERARLTLASQPRLAGLKHLNRLEQVLAAAELKRGIDEVLVGDSQNRPVGGSRSNVFWVRRGRLFTPRLDHCGVAGMMRDKILEIAKRQKIPVVVGAANWQPLSGADELFVSNSLIGIWPVRRFGTRRWIAPGPVTTLLSKHLNHPRLEQT